MGKAIVFGLVGGLALGGLWNLQDTYPIVANIVIILLAVPLTVMALRIK
jgi:hypothetical protein